MKKLFYIIIPCVLALSACGGGSSSSDSASNEIKEPSVPQNSQPLFNQSQPMYTFGYASAYLQNQYVFTLTNNIISERLKVSNSAKVINTSSSGDVYLIAQDRVYYQKELNLDANGEAVPQEYFISDDGATLTTSFYNSDGVNPSIRKSMSYKRYDVSGLKVKDYIHKNFLTSTDNPTSAAALNANTQVFPQGSVIYIPGIITYLDEHYRLYAGNHRVSYNSFNEVPDIAKYPLIRVFGGVEIHYSKDTSLGYGLYNGKVYQTDYRPKNYQYYDNPNNNYFYNDIAAQIVGDALVSSCGDKVYHDSRSGCF